MATGTHPNGRPYGMGKRDWYLMQQTRIGPLERKLAANKFDSQVKEHGLTEAMRLNGITE